MDVGDGDEHYMDRQKRDHLASHSFTLYNTHQELPLHRDVPETNLSFKGLSDQTPPSNSKCPDMQGRG